MNCDAAKILLVQIGRNSLLDAKLRGMALEHARDCRHCGLRLANERMLSTGLELLAREHLALDPPPGLQAALMTEFRGEFAKKNTKRTHARLWSATAAIAACIAIVSAVRPLLRSNSAQEVRSALLPESEADGQGSFISIPYAEPIEPYERTELQRVTVARATLTAMGLGVEVGQGFAPDPDEPVNAELVVGQDGVPRAVRLLN